MPFRYLAQIVLILVVSVNFCQAQQRVFDLNLDECVESAYEKNMTLLQLEERINSAKYQIDEARSGFYPQFSFSGSYTRLGELPSYDVGSGMKFSLGTKNNYNLSLPYQQPLFTWGKIRAGHDLSKYNLSLTKEEYRRTKQDMKFTVVNLFYNILLAKELIKVREESIARSEDHLKTVQERYDKGYASEFDVLRVKVQLANSKPPLT